MGMVTIQAVEVTPDYAHAKIFFSLLVGDAEGMRGSAQPGGRLPAQRPVQAPAHPHRADAALPVRPHDRARGRHERLDRQGRLLARKRRLAMNAPRTRVQRRPVHGVLLLDKPLGLSSNDALQKCQWLLRAEKAGHTGTLDPLATGVLPLCFGAATKFSQLQLDADKTYEATVRLGVKTATGDAEGEVIERAAGSGDHARAPGRGGQAVHRRDPPGAAHAQRPEEGRQGPVRVRAGRRSKSSARRATWWSGRWNLPLARRRIP